jgi:alpha-1,3-rhamnosyltransferase
MPGQPNEIATVAVMVPSYNHAPFVEATLRSIFNQTLQPARILVIDDGSSDDSVKVIETTLNDCPFPSELIARENRGLSATLNEGVARLGDCDYFAYLGSDDAWLPAFLSERIRLLNGRPAAVLTYGHAYSIDADDRIIDCSTDWAAYSDGDARKMLLGGVAPLSPTVVYRRSALDGQHWNESSRLEDYEMYLRLSASGEFAFDPQVLSAWRQHSYNTILDLDMMLAEKLAALESTAPVLKLTDGQVAGYQRLARFRTAQDMMRQGRKPAAARIGLTALTAAPSASEAVRFIAGLLVPTRVHNQRRRRYRRAAGLRYGSLASALDPNG